MSLINDALKRAKQVQHDPLATPPGPPLRPVEPALYVRHGVGVIVPVSMTLVALFGLLLLWQMYQRRDASNLVPAGQPMAQHTAVGLEPAAQTAPQTSVSVPGANPIRSAPASTGSAPEPAKANLAPAPTALINPSTSDATVVASGTNAISQDGAATNAVAAAQPLVPKPAPLRLQGIVFDPKRPSAVINGKTLFLRDRIGEFRVTAIKQDSVTVVGGGRTTLLTLEP